MIDQVREFIKKENLLDKGDRLTLGVSGGADSVCLLLICLELSKEYELDIDVVHVMHGIRGEDARSDAEFVKSLCNSLNVPVKIYEVDVPEFAEKEKLSTEEAARILRYRMLKEHTDGKIAVAHHAEDNAETILMQMIRGTGISGLGGMSPLSNVYGNTVIRPLLCVRRAQIEGYLSENGQSFCNDMTNFDTLYSRNKLRLKVFPLLEEINTGAIEHMNYTASLIREWKSDILSSAAQILDDVSRDRDIIKSQLSKFPISLQKEVIKLWLTQQTKGAKDIGHYHIEEIAKLMNSDTGKSIDLPGDYRVVSDYDNIRLINIEADEDEYPLSEVISIPPLELGQVYEELYGDYHFYFAVLENMGDTPPKDDFSKWIDYDKVKDDLVIRTRQEGDYIYINSLKKKSFGRFCIDEKISRDKRSEIPLLCFGDHILWALGYRISEEAKVTSDTKRILSIEVTKY